MSEEIETNIPVDVNADEEHLKEKLAGLPTASDVKPPESQPEPEQNGEPAPTPTPAPQTDSQPQPQPPAEAPAPAPATDEPKPEETPAQDGPGPVPEVTPEAPANGQNVKPDEEQEPQPQADQDLAEKKTSTLKGKMNTMKERFFKKEKGNTPPPPSDACKVTCTGKMKSWFKLGKKEKCTKPTDTVKLAENHPNKERFDQMLAQLVASEPVPEGEEGTETAPAPVFSRVAISDLEGALIAYNPAGFSPTVEQVRQILDLLKKREGPGENAACTAVVGSLFSVGTTEYICEKLEEGSGLTGKVSVSVSVKEEKKEEPEKKDEEAEKKEKEEAKEGEEPTPEAQPEPEAEKKENGLPPEMGGILVQQVKSYLLCAAFDGQPDLAQTGGRNRLDAAVKTINDENL